MQATYAVLWRFFLGVMLLLPLFGVSGAYAQSQDSQAQRQQVQPGNNAPVWRDVRSGKEEYTSIKGRETGVLIQTYGDTWRQLRNGPITVYGGWLVVLAIVALGMFYQWKGQIKLHEKPTGRMMERFSSFERISHWTVAISFCILGISGLIILFGKHVLLPVIGYTLFAWLTVLSKNLHNFVGPIFIFGIVVMIVVYARDNLPKAYDFLWLKKFGGLISGDHVPAGRFNAGEKGWFWVGVVLLGTVMSVSGLIMDFPNFDQVRAVMIQANIVHAIAAVIFISLAFAHIYLGTIGMEGAYEGMRNGYVDEAWVKEHHEYWYNDVKSGKIKTGSAAPAGTPQTQH
jgi:formate dehydrogenase subunit gamma